MQNFRPIGGQLDSANSKLLSSATATPKMLGAIPGVMLGIFNLAQKRVEISDKFAGLGAKFKSISNLKSVKLLDE
jgi:hypothetical protein